MVRYISRRLLQSFVVVLLVTVITFTILHMLPGGAARSALGLQATQEQLDAYAHQMGYDRPIYEQYISYLGQLIRGELGTSFALNMDVSQAIAQRLPKTMLLSFCGLVLAVIIAIPLGMLQAWKRNRWPDYLITALALLMYSTPLFFMGLLLIVAFSQVWPILPPEAPQGFTVSEMLADWQGLILPSVTLAIVSLAAYTRYVRSSMVDNLEENYIRTARAKGLSESRVVMKHAMRNSLFPVITLLGMSLPGLFSGGLVVESLFNYPGMGLMYWQAAQGRDYPILLAVTTIISIATVIGALLADIMYAIADPRVRYGGGDAR
ncbi:ABC transporter permease [Arcanobacterium haemolyticum]|uniref:Binding-protein-dependent transport systems inner membrane component n=1 Tax=Arcanobacterium haemolyticum (strain ATCC 9345 / DSM 20595 / CCM 5947 / CCUG 17215 / LMG 16163 / NBRC 15585 / NCTC 8452 / 11018) TaxID=644284 RepID=D7BLM1_ARCHD|nr:ABC transporter permease [Arcanobacterium haemolyticum]ADH91820.1 binding-protein-dependent transport systems inner membrane component [Arcanobacterium haemolyticum DSM 20595]QCX46022.1 ABC transporter permease [Arcanobacterium haemolyticum]SPT74691.1 Glutathione transport system permease protein gsiC [Arcanobacterium haemolyticum]SQH27335.1 Glutathione transport system permease protein gsiC [Arcanobacterium haemolyticum]